jgi:hypothetical protein
MTSSLPWPVVMRLGSPAKTWERCLYEWQAADKLSLS